CGVIGTINSRWNGKEYPVLNTTPESRDIQKILCSMKEDGVEYAVMEVSSHALVLERAAHVNFDSAVFTNLTGEHLDFHRDMDDYFAAKLRLFDLLEESPKKEKIAAVNIDDEYGAQIFAMRKKYSYEINGFGLKDSADFSADAASIQNKISGLSYSMRRPFPGTLINLNCAGGFQLYNSLSAVSALASMNIPLEAICRGLAELKGVPGRFDVVSRDGVSAVIDYAHTGDALLKLLDSVNEVRTGKIITVFGCGGDRDKTKRPLMGKIASEKSDIVVVTSDNPRTEPPDSIIAGIVAGINGKNYTIIPDRASAITEAVAMAGVGDIVVIAGKGHEDYQILGKEKIHFDDREEALKALSARSKN
ncbi:MAG: UDP-N-acetylmuramoyl-L-alanyl-D-glutamate--2,6-diaminopimelate ligase, partial [Leptospirales bacterium]|nr:UDP-N-acetylmuramoyl-L-alanyl-D-glutamate--2,6-diaminopimelate ligase [Leptospirales bacterium]